jgi:DNA modification methylase
VERLGERRRAATVTPYYDEDGITIWHGDCRDVLPGLAAGAAGLTLTDPPYGIGVAHCDPCGVQTHLADAGVYSPGIGSA